MSKGEREGNENISLAARIECIPKSQRSTDLFIAEITHKEMDSIALKRLSNVKHVDVVAPVHECLHNVLAKKAAPTHHSTQLAGALETGTWLD